MMHKLFSYVPGYNETNINIKLNAYDRVTRVGITVARSRQSSLEDFKEAEEAFKEKLAIYMTSKNIEVKIELRGKLSGADMNLVFIDLDSYHQFLENNNLRIKIAKLDN